MHITYALFTTLYKHIVLDVFLNTEVYAFTLLLCFMIIKYVFFLFLFFNSFYDLNTLPMQKDAVQ